MKKSLAIFALLASVLSSRAELSVEWIDGNTIRVSGTGYTVITNNVCTNALGSCTNCVQISPQQMHTYKTNIISRCDSTDSDLDGIIHSALKIYERMNQMWDDISSFRRFGDYPNDDSISTSVKRSFTNYVSGVDNSQTYLDRSVDPHSFSNSDVMRWISYNNGIYDYANNYVLSNFTSSKNDAEEIVYQADSAKAHISTIRSIVSGMSEAECQGCSAGDGGGGGGGGGSCGDCPCAEQLDAINDYVKHIDDDFHDQLLKMSVVTNYTERMDSYARFVSGILYNDATIVVDDGDNSWSNVYRRGYSDLYDYDKSNILQRIELLLFGVTYNTSTNWGNSVDSIDETSDELRGNFNDAKTEVISQADSLNEDIGLIEKKFTAFVSRLNFFGTGTLGEFSVSDPFTVFGAYDFDITSSGLARDLAPLQQMSRTCFQVFYWISAAVFMIWFWWSFIRFVINHVFTLLKFFNNLLT